MFRHVFLTFLLSIILNVITIFIGIVSNVSSMMCHTAFSPLSKFYLILYVFNLVTANICVEFGMECLVLYLPIFKQFPTKFLLLIDPQLFLFQRIMRGLSTRNFLIYISQILTQNPLKLCTIFLQTSIVDYSVFVNKVLNFI